MMKIKVFCLFFLLSTVWAINVQVPFIQRNYGCPTGCSCTLLSSATTPAAACTAVGSGTCACTAVGTSGAYTGCTVSGAAPGATSNGCLVGNTVTCTNFQTDPNNCGQCANKCSAGTGCTAGACALTCPSGQTLCGGVCVNTLTDGSNCGGCGTVCPRGVTCTSGACVCPTGQTLCSGTCVNFQTDSDNCGGCGLACPAGVGCTAGACACPTGQSLCSGVCVDEQTNANNCGSCGTKCPTGISCATGACSCPVGQIVCGGTCVPVSTTNCGTCNTICSGATPACSGTGGSALCVAGTGYTDRGCASDSTLGTYQGTPSSAIQIPYGSSYTSNDCYNFCLNTASSPSYFTLVVDTTSSIQQICQCYTGGTAPTTAQTDPGCISDHGVTNTGTGSYEVFSIP
jgi:hypothetical protein